MAMSKAKRREWPWNNTPSKRHVWKYEHPIERCLRCGCLYNPQREARAAVYCYPRPDWIKDHPGDDGKQG